MSSFLSLSLFFFFFFFFFFSEWGKNELHQTIASGREKVVLKMLRLENTKIMKKVHSKYFMLVFDPINALTGLIQKAIKTTGISLKTLIVWLV